MTTDGARDLIMEFMKHVKQAAELTLGKKLKTELEFQRVLKPDMADPIILSNFAKLLSEAMNTALGEVPGLVATVKDLEDKLEANKAATKIGNGIIGIIECLPKPIFSFQPKKRGQND